MLDLRDEAKRARLQRLLDLCGGYEHACDALQRGIDNATTSAARWTLINLRRSFQHYYIWG